MGPILVNNLFRCNFLELLETFVFFNDQFST